MSAKFLLNMDVTAQELYGLQHNRIPWKWLTDRQREILRAGHAEYPCNVVHMSTDNKWEAIGEAWLFGFPLLCTYRLHETLTLPVKPQRPTEPFKWAIGGQELWCCPVRTHRKRMVFTRPGGCGDWPITEASAYQGFLGCMTADSEGMPDWWLGCGARRDLSHLLDCHHDGCAENQIAFVCFEVT